MTKADLTKDLIGSVEKYRIENHTTIDHAAEVAVEQLRKLQSVANTKKSRRLRKLYSKSEFLQSLRSNLPWWKRWVA